MIVRAFGLYWNVSAVDWDDKKMLGVDDESAPQIETNAWKQSGIYCLYNEFLPIYVGRALNKNLGDRICSHLTDRLAGRWDSFSWFGVHQVNKVGSLRSFENRLNSRDVIIKSLEAFALIAFDPRLNRRHEKLPNAQEFVQMATKTKAIRTLVEEIHAKVFDPSN